MPDSGRGTHRAIAGERASFVVESHDARGNRLTAGGAPLAVVVRALGDDGPGGGDQGQILDYGNGAYEASYVTRVAGPYEVALVLGTEELVMKGHCEAGRAVVSGCILLGDAVLDLEVGVKGRFSIERRDAYGNRTPSRQGQLALRCSADGPGTVDVHVVDGAEGRSDVVASADVAGRYFLTVVGGDNQDPVPGSPFELVAYPGAAAASASVTSVYGAQLASPDSDVLAAVAGDEITLTVAPAGLVRQPDCFRTRRSRLRLRRRRTRRARDCVRRPRRTEGGGDNARLAQHRGVVPPLREGWRRTLGRVPSHLADCPRRDGPASVRALRRGAHRGGLRPRVFPDDARGGSFRKPPRDGRRRD